MSLPGGRPCARAAGEGYGRADTGPLLGAAFLLGVLLLGCGARAANDGSTADEDELGRAGRSGAGGTRGPDRGTAGNVGAPPDRAEPLDIGGVTLPDCELGLPVSSAGSRDCSYLAAGNCYEDPEMACACACQGLADNRCIIGGFLNPEEPQTVRCTAR